MVSRAEKLAELVDEWRGMSDQDQFVSGCDILLMCARQLEEELYTSANDERAHNIALALYGVACAWAGGLGRGPDGSAMHLLRRAGLTYGEEEVWGTVNGQRVMFEIRKRK